MFPSEEGRSAHAFLYRPASAGVPRSAPASGRPSSCGATAGPTSAASPALRLGLQYWTSRGFAVIDVDYAGSTGYGRAYRNLLRGQWGVRDLADCAAAARFAAAQGAADPARLLASGGSAGGYTTLCLLTFRDEFAAGRQPLRRRRPRGPGARHPQVRVALPRAPDRPLARPRGPLPRALARCITPRASPGRVIFFQGLDDRVVPPAQTEAMVEALARRGVPHAYVAFEGEGHGFRRAENLETALEGERWFYAKMLGFEAGPPPPPGAPAAAPARSRA